MPKPMKGRTAIMTLAALSFLQLPLSAQDVPKYVFTGSYGYTRIERNNWKGWNASALRNLGRYLGIAFDVGGAVSRLTGNSGGITFRSERRAYTFLAGPRATLTDERKTAPFIHLLLGAANESVNIENHQNGVVLHVSSYNETDFAMALGGGMDYVLKGPCAIRGQFDYIGFRKSATTLSPTYWEKGIRLSVGLTFRFGALDR